MKYIKQIKILVLIGSIILPLIGFSQFQIEGNYRFRLYSDHFSEALDNRKPETYIRQLGQIKAAMKLNSKTRFVSELITFTDNEYGSPVRNIGGTGKMFYGLSSLYAEHIEAKLGFIDLLRLRVGRQQFQLGKGLTQGDSYYYINNFDGARLDMDIRGFKLTGFGAITKQNLSGSGLYPDPGSDQIYILRLTKYILGHDLMGYYVYNKLRGDFNDSEIFGGAITASWLNNRFTYFVEGAYQNSSTISGLPAQHGLGYMGGISYRFVDVSIFKSIKIETRYAAYQGDDSSTDDFEQFSPLYPDFYWGDRQGWVNGYLGGLYPHDGRYAEGTRIWFSRIYFVPTALSQLRIQFQYLKIDEYINNDNYNDLVSEYSVKLYYKLSRQSELQVRYVINKSNTEDRDINGNGIISWSEDKVDYTRFMVGLNFKF